MAEDVQEDYEQLISRSRELAVLSSCSALLHWDEQTYIPRGGSAHRAEQMAYLAGLHHERATNPRFAELLDIVGASDLVADPESPPAVNVRELRRNYERKIRRPRDLVEVLARTTSLAQQEWITARSEARFERLRPWLKKIIQLKRQEAACLREVGGSSKKAPDCRIPGATLYDALLDDYEPGARSAELAVLFQALHEELVPVVQTIKEASARRTRDGQGSQGGAAAHDDAILRRAYPLDRQRVFGETVAAALGFDFQRGRLDVTAHPFCTGIGPGDTRIATRYDERQFTDAFFGVLHEVGHALYEQGLLAEHFGTPMGEAVSLGVHESQSRLWENAVGRSQSFWMYWFPIARRVFHSALHDVALDQFLAAVNHVEPSLIRVQADEVTYNLHIIIRFELEQALLADELPISALPDTWNQKYREALGVMPANDAEGCLQDIHWSAGLLGYFPTYTLGNVYAAQLFARARADLAGLDGSFARGDFGELLAWLRDSVHRHGQRYRSVRLIERATIAKPNHGPLVTALWQKYGELYGL